MVNEGEAVVNEKKFERHWQTQRLVDVFAAMEVGGRSAWADIAASCDVAMDAIKKRVQSARRAALHEHNAIIVSVRGYGVERVPQDEANRPAVKYMAGARNKARRATNVFRHGITNWDKIERSKKNEMFVTQAQCAVVAQVTKASARKKLAVAAETANTKLDFGRTMELLK